MKFGKVKGCLDTAKLKFHKVPIAQLSITGPLLQFAHAIAERSYIKYVHVLFLTYIGE